MLHTLTSLPVRAKSRTQGLALIFAYHRSSKYLLGESKSRVSTEDMKAVVGLSSVGRGLVSRKHEIRSYRLDGNYTCMFATHDSNTRRRAQQAIANPASGIHAHNIMQRPEFGAM